MVLFEMLQIGRNFDSIRNNVCAHYFSVNIGAKMKVLFGLNRDDDEQ
jgi:hypothetical protein